MLDPGDRSGLIEITARLAPTPGCRRAFVIGWVEVLGGFRIPFPCWFLEVTGQHGTKWLLAVIPNDRTHDYDLRLWDRVPWGHWLGVSIRGTGYSIYRGDYPLLYEMLWRNSDATGNQANSGGVRRACDAGGRPGAPDLG